MNHSIKLSPERSFEIKYKYPFSWKDDLTSTIHGISKTSSKAHFSYKIRKTSMCKKIRSTQYDIIILSKQINIVEDPTDEEDRDEMNYVQEEVRGKNCLNSLHL